MKLNLSLLNGALDSQRRFKMFENSYFTKPIHVTLLCLYMILTSIGIAGGVLVWVILLRRRRLRNPINYMLLNMSLSDIIASLTLYLYISILDPGTVSDSQKTSTVSMFSDSRVMSIFRCRCVVIFHDMCNELLSIRDDQISHAS